MIHKPTYIHIYTNIYYYIYLQVHVYVCICMCTYVPKGGGLIGGGAYFFNIPQRGGGLIGGGGGLLEVVLRYLHTYTDSDTHAYEALAIMHSRRHSRAASHVHLAIFYSNRHQWFYWSSILNIALVLVFQEFLIWSWSGEIF